MDFLDVARGGAAMLVLVEHGLHLCVPGYLDWSRSNFMSFHAALIMFFIVSGFVIPSSLEAGKSVAGFWRRRCFRLLPVYWLSIALAAIGMWSGSSLFQEFRNFDRATWISNITWTQFMVDRPYIWGVFWTLPFEMLIYAVCSILFATGILSRMGTRFVSYLVMTFAAIGIVRPFVLSTPFEVGGLRMLVLSAVVGFAAQRYAAGIITRRSFYSLLCAFGAALVAIWTVNWALFPAEITWRKLLNVSSVWSLALACFLTMLELRDRSMPRWACRLGQWSYPIYLLHPFVILVLRPMNLSAPMFMLTLASATLALAAIVHRFVESPAIEISRPAKRATILKFGATSVPVRQAA